MVILHLLTCLWVCPRQWSPNIWSPSLLLSISAAISVFMRWLWRPSVALRPRPYSALLKNNPSQSHFHPDLASTLLPRLVAMQRRLMSKIVNAYSIMRSMFAYVTKFALDCQRGSFISGALQWMQRCLWWNSVCKRVPPPTGKKLASGHLFIWLYTYIFIFFS